MTSIFLKDSFDSAHWLPNVAADHKCHRLHGHTYRVEIHVTGKVDAVSGFVNGLDYSDIKAAWREIHDLLDHRTLNDVIANPTCELIAGLIAAKMVKAGIPVALVRLNETEHCGAIWQAEARMREELRG